MDQQPTDPNNPTPIPIPPPTNGSSTSIWDAQPNSPVTAEPGTPAPIPATPPPVAEPVPTFIPPVPPVPTTPNFGENSVSVSPVPAGPDASSVPNWAAVNDVSSNTPPEAMPTDLSNLMGNAPVSSTETAQPTIVMPPPNPEVNQVVTGGSRGFPRIILILGAILVLVVIGASAYFILGVGNSANLPTSVPAEQQTLTTPPKQIVPSVVPLQTGTGSATLGNPSGATLSATPIPTTTSGSAIDLLRSRITPTPVR